MSHYAMTLLQAVAEHRGIRAAARSLNLSPSTVSRELKAFSEQLGLPLIERVDGQTTPTRPGEVLLLLANQQRKDWETTVQALRDTHLGSQQPPIRLGAFSSAQQFVVLDAVKSLQDRASMRVYVVAVEAEDARRSVAHANLDGAICIAEMPHTKGDGLVTHPLWRERFVLAIPRELRMPFATGGARSLGGVPWILPPTNSVWNQLVHGFFRTLEVRPRVIGRSDDWLVNQQMAGMLEAATLVPATTFSPQGRLRRVSLPAGLLPRRTVTLVTREDVSWSPLMVQAISSKVQAITGEFDGDIELPARSD